MMPSSSGFTAGESAVLSNSELASITEGTYNPTPWPGPTDAPIGTSSRIDAPIGTSLASMVGYKAGTAQWRERIENYSPWNDVFSMSQQETELIIDVPFDNRYLFLIYALGYNYVDATGRLRRINPIVHPYWNWMRCARVAHRGVKFMGNKITTVTGPPGVARYKLARFSLGFANYPWRFYEDSEMTQSSQEIYRNVYFEFQPSTQFLSAEGGANMLKFPYGATKNPYYDPAGGTTVPPYIAPATYLGGLGDAQPVFKATLGTPVNQINYKLHWKWVPYAYVFKGLVPVNLYKAMNTLNLFPFLDGPGVAPGTNPNMPKGTMRFDTPQITTFVSPIRTGGTPELLCDIVLNMAYFDPPRLFVGGSGVGPADDPKVYDNQIADRTLAQVRGHNLMPDRLTNLWKPATRDGGTPTDNNQMYLLSDHYQVFVQPT